MLITYLNHIHVIEVATVASVLGSSKEIVLAAHEHVSVVVCGASGWGVSDIL